MRTLNRLFTRLPNFAVGRRGDEPLAADVESRIDPREARHARLKLAATEAVREGCHAKKRAVSA